MLLEVLEVLLEVLEVVLAPKRPKEPPRFPQELFQEVSKNLRFAIKLVRRPQRSFCEPSAGGLPY